MPDTVDVVYLDGEGVAYDSGAQNIHYLNSTAAIVYRLCDGSATTAEIVSDVADAYEMPEPVVDLQVRGLIRELRKRGILEAATRPRSDSQPDMRKAVRQEVPRST